MGFEYKVLPVEQKVLDRLTCDRCNVEIKKTSDGGWNQYGEPFSNFHEPSFEGCFHLKYSWGYGSGKDGESHEAILCEACYDAVFKDVKIAITRYM